VQRNEKVLQSSFSFVGDSDIARWPQHLLPQVLPVSPHDDHDNSATCQVTTFHHAENGATMQRLVAQIKRAKKEISSSSFDATVFIACAGENDISTTTSTPSLLDRILEQFESAVRCIFSSTTKKRMFNNPHFIFIGPKVEPWMEQDELNARMCYFQLSESLRSTISKLSSCPTLMNSVDTTRSNSNHSIYFLDSLTLFCGETQNKSVVGGRAIAERKYFQEDGLHLSHDGYEIWKKQVEDILHHDITFGEMGDD
jgi:hypothetical protein